MSTTFAMDALQLLERDDFSSSRHPALHYWWSMTPACAGAGLFRKPVSTFRDHAPKSRVTCRSGGRGSWGALPNTCRSDLFRIDEGFFERHRLGDQVLLQPIGQHRLDAGEIGFHPVRQGVAYER